MLNNVVFVGAGLVPARLPFLSEKPKTDNNTGQPQRDAPTKGIEPIDTMDHMDAMDNPTRERKSKYA